MKRKEIEEEIVRIDHLGKEIERVIKICYKNYKHDPDERRKLGYIHRMLILESKIRKFVVRFHVLQKVLESYDQQNRS